MDALVSTRVVRAMTRTLRRRRHGPDTTGRAPLSVSRIHARLPRPCQVRRLHRRRQPTATGVRSADRFLRHGTIRIRVDVGCCTFFHWTGGSILHGGGRRRIRVRVRSVGPDQARARVSGAARTVAPRHPLLLHSLLSSSMAPFPS